MSKFFNWLNAQDIPELAKELNVVPETVRAWSYGRSCPRPPLLKRLTEISGGAFSFDDVLADTERAKKQFQRGKR